VSEPSVVEAFAEDDALGVQACPDVALAISTSTSVNPDRQRLARLFVILETEALCAAPADDIVELLVSSALLAKALMQLDRDLCSHNVETQCFDALAALKGSLRQVTWSRALE
jgi:hypothetical protein